MLSSQPLALGLRHGALGLLLCASCTQAADPREPVQPAAEPAAPPGTVVDTAPDLAFPPPLGSRESSQEQPVTPSEPNTAGPLPSQSVAERIRELQGSLRVFRELDLEGRTAHLSDVYQHELLELGQTFASIRPGHPEQRVYFVNKAVSAFEELAFDAGEDSDLGVRAYQHLADLKRETGLLEEAEDYEEALQRLLDERDD